MMVSDDTIGVVLAVGAAVVAVAVLASRSAAGSATRLMPDPSFSAPGGGSSTAGLSQPGDVASGQTLQEATGGVKPGDLSTPQSIELQRFLGQQSDSGIRFPEAQEVVAGDRTLENRFESRHATETKTTFSL